MTTVAIVRTAMENVFEAERDSPAFGLLCHAKAYLLRQAECALRGLDS